MMRCAEDEKTCIISNDENNGALLMYVLRNPGDVSEGRLFASKFTQLAEVDGTTCKGTACAGEFTIEWIPMDADYVKGADIAAAAKTVKFSDLFDWAAHNASAPCPNGLQAVRTNFGAECLKVKEGQAVFASRFETTRYAALQGATTEWTKMEGFDFAPELRKGYLAMSSIATSMTNAHTSDVGGPNHVRVPENFCGCVYEMDMTSMMLPGSAIYSDYVFTAMRGLTCGKPITGGDAVLGIEGNNCDVAGIANPDNLVWGLNVNTLFIAEDTSNHLQDFIWAFDTEGRTMTRVFAGVFGAEITGLSWNKNFFGQGASYLGVVVQHPYGENDGVHLFDSDSIGMAGFVGLVGPFHIPKPIVDMGRPIDLEQGWGCNKVEEACPAADSTERCRIHTMMRSKAVLTVRFNSPVGVSSITVSSEDGGVLGADAEKQLMGLEVNFRTSNTSVTYCELPPSGVNMTVPAKPGYAGMTLRCFEQGGTMAISLPNILNGAGVNSFNVKVCVVPRAESHVDLFVKKA